MSKWSVKYDNDVGPGDEGFWEWWDVTDGTVTFRADSEDAATWLCDLLNKNEAAQVAGMGK